MFSIIDWKKYIYIPLKSLKVSFRPGFGFSIKINYF